MARDLAKGTVVINKIDVREAAARLPDEGDKLGPLGSEALEESGEGSNAVNAAEKAVA